MYCNKCGAQIQESAKFCPKCGAARIQNPGGSSSGRNPSGHNPAGQQIKAGSLSSAGQPPVHAASPVAPPTEPPRKQKSGVGVVVLVLLLIALIGGGGFAAFRLLSARNASGSETYADADADEKEDGQDESDEEEEKGEREEGTESEREAEKVQEKASDVSEVKTVVFSASVDALETAAAMETAGAEIASSDSIAEAAVPTGPTGEALTYPAELSQTYAPSAAPETAPAYQSQVPVQTPAYQTMYVVNCNEYITLRRQPSTSASAIRTIPLGAAVSFVANASNGFYQVSYLGDTGYALASYLSTSPTSSYTPPATQAASASRLRVVNCDAWISLRSSPSTSASRITTIPLGATVTFLGTASNGFYRISYGGYTGYALGSYLQWIQ